MTLSMLARGPLAQVVPDVVTDVVDTTDVSTWDPLWAGVTVVVGVLVAYLARRTTRRSCEAVGLPQHIVDLSGTLVTWSIIAMSVLVALGFLGLAPNWLWLVALFLLIAFIVGGRVLMESFGAGVMLQARAPFTPGDLVRIGEDNVGVVVEVNSRVVILDAIDGERIFIPNQMVLRGTIANLTQGGKRMSTVLLDVVYGTDLDVASRVAEDAVAAADGVLQDPAPIAEVIAFEASAVRIQLRFWHAPDLLSEWAAIDAASRSAYVAFSESEIEFAFPQQTLWWGDESVPDSDS